MRQEKTYGSSLLGDGDIINSSMEPQLLSTPTEQTYPQLFVLDTGIGGKEIESAMRDLTVWETVEKPQWFKASSFTPKAHGDVDDDDDSDDDAGVSSGAGPGANRPAVNATLPCSLAKRSARERSPIVKKI